MVSASREHVRLPMSARSRQVLPPSEDFTVAPKAGSFGPSSMVKTQDQRAIGELL